MTTADIVILIILLFGAYRGYKEGFLMELFSLIGIILGILGGFKLMGTALIYLDNHFDIDEKWLPYVAFGLVFLVILIVVILIGKSIKASIDKTFLGRIDETAGAAIGLLKIAFLISVALWLIHSAEWQLPDEWTANSIILPLVSSFAPTVSAWIGDLIPAFNDIFK